MAQKMPRVNLENLTGFDLEAAKAITIKGRLRASKPRIEYELYADEYGLRHRRPTAPTGLYAYVWRMVAFCASPHHRHHCMPMLAFCDLPGKDVGDTGKIENEMKPVIDRILDQIDPREWHGIRRWGQAYGLVGTPRYDDDGAVIYR
jgi:hypothetical protein